RHRGSGSFRLVFDLTTEYLPQGRPAPQPPTRNRSNSFCFSSAGRELHPAPKAAMPAHQPSTKAGKSRRRPNCRTGRVAQGVVLAWWSLEEQPVLSHPTARRMMHATTAARLPWLPASGSKLLTISELSIVTRARSGTKDAALLVRLLTQIAIGRSGVRVAP